MKERDFHADKCHRCGGSTQAGFILSWFTLEIICQECSARETEIKRQLRARGIHNALEGCGYVPSLEGLR